MPCITIEEEFGPYFIIALLFVTAFFLFLPFLTFLISNYLNLPLETQGSSRRLEPFFHKKEMGDT